MPLDPQARTFLDQIAALGNPPPAQMSPVQARTQMTAMAGLASQPAARVASEDRGVSGPAGDIAVRIYRPPSPTPLPIVVFFHGGGFVIGSVETHDATCQQLAAGVPAVVVSVEYRLAPEDRFPAAVEDCDAVTRWVADHAAELGSDPARLAVAGDSAGGNLAAVVARRARDNGGPPIAFQLLVYPATDMTRSSASHKENGEGYLLTTEMIDWFMDHYFGPDQASKVGLPDASPLFVDRVEDLPPALVITAEFDPLRDEGEDYAERLRGAGVAAHTSRYDGMIHGFFGMDAVFDSAKLAMDEAITALRAALA